MNKWRYQLFLGLLVITFIGLSIGIASHYTILKPTVKTNQTTAMISTTTSSTTTPLTITPPTTTTIGNTQKCINAGGECKQNCDSATTGSVSSNFLQGIINWLLELFSASKPNQSAATGSVFGSSSMQEIGSYPEYCTEQLSKCCKPITITSTSLTTISSTASSPSATTSVTTITTITIAEDQASNLIANELYQAIAGITNQDIMNAINS